VVPKYPAARVGHYQFRSAKRALTGDFGETGQRWSLVSRLIQSGRRTARNGGLNPCRPGLIRRFREQQGRLRRSYLVKVGSGVGGALVCGRLLAKMAGAREGTMDTEQGAPEVDLEELSRYIADRTGIPAEVVARVLEAETEYLIERGIAQAEQ
jgi:hypothetical protein